MTAAVLLTGCRAGYVVKSGWYQLELLRSREPIEDALAGDTYSASQARQLALVPRLREYGEREIGLSRSGNYETVSAGWNRELYNLSACEPLAFEPRTWWFPVVGRVPYLGFFRYEDADRNRRRYEARGYDVWVRPVGAYSTLGWFRDPVLPGMLDWSEYRLAETVFHELAHATLWIRGNVNFNETFANVVGEAAAERWIRDTYGPDSAELRDVYLRREDGARIQELLQELYNDLDEVYKNKNMAPEKKHQEKTRIIASIESRVQACDLHYRERWLAWARRGPWNNARLAQGRTYNDDRDAFERLLQRHDGDIRAFIGSVEEATRGASDPYAAIEAAVSRSVQKP